MFVLILITVIVSVVTEEQRSKPLSVDYQPDEPRSVELKHLGKFENDVNEARNLTRVQARGREHILVEGDMIAPQIERQIENINSSRPIVTKGSTSGLWPNGRVPYTLATSITGYKKDTILSAMEHWSSQTCLKFVKRKKWDNDYIEFYNGGGCYSDLGRIGGKQQVSIGPGCVKLGIIVHEIGHSMGFYHEQSRPDRDTYVRIRLQNAKPGTSTNFQKYSRDYIDTHGTDYDYGSIMHYRENAFSANGEATIEPIVKDGQDKPQMGQRIKLSQQDVALAKTMYNCAAPAPPEPELELTCEDRTTMCLDWADANLCTTGSFVVFMIKSCQLSCGVCSPAPFVKTVFSSQVVYVLESAVLVVEQVEKKAVTLRVEAPGAVKVHIMYKEVGTEDWSYGMYRMYSGEPVYTVHNLNNGTVYGFVVRYTKDEVLWSEFSDELAIKTKK